MNPPRLLRQRGDMVECGQRGKQASVGLLSALTAVLLLALGASSAGRAAVGTTFPVDTNDGTTDFECGGASGDCSFGDAIHEANLNPGKDTIAFAIPGPGPHVIVLPTLAAGPFPTVTDAVVIDAETQPGYDGTPEVEVDVGGRLSFGLLIQGPATAGTEIRGLAIYGSTSGNDNAIDFHNPGDNVVERNYIGLDASGTVVKGSGTVAMQPICCGDPSSNNTVADNVLAGLVLDNVDGSRVVRNKIGTLASGEVGLTPTPSATFGIYLAGGAGNLFAGNVIARRNVGIYVDGFSGQPSPGNRIEGNKIGTDVTGTAALGNTIGIFNAEAVATVIGGTDPAARNLISGNGRGILLSSTAGGLGDGVVVQGNFIGTDAAGDVALGNDQFGLSVGADDVLVADNVISGNGGHGVVASGSRVRIERNLIGTNAAGTAMRGNGGDGVSAGGLVDSVVGGDSPTQRNVISANGGVGVQSAVALQILNNYIGTDVTGAQDFGNGGDGVRVANGTIVGKPGAGNVISGNGGAGVRALCCIEGAVVQSNLIGTDSTGTQDLGNGGAGVLAGSNRDFRIGGSASGEGNVISGNGGWGIEVGLNGGGNRIEGNRIGSDGSGAAAIANDGGGLTIAAPFLGTTNHIVRNLISGNAGDGVEIRGGPHHLLGNLIGTDLAGAAALGNTGDGVDLVLSSQGANVVGGLGAGEGNVISGNGGRGLLVASPRNTILGNRIGTDAGGGETIANGLSGIRLASVESTLESNVVSGNGGDGIEIAGARNALLGNRIGTGGDGTSSLGNARHGISIDGGGAILETTVGPQEDTGEGNTIAFNGEHGVFITRAHRNLVRRNHIFSNGADGVAVVGAPPQGAIQNRITENSISANGGLGIDLQNDGVTPNDPGDADGGTGFAGLANFLQNTPVNLQVSLDGTTVTGTLNSRANIVYRVELFGNGAGAACDPSGSGEGEEYLTSVDVTTDASGNAAISATLPEPLAAGHVVTATATEPEGSAAPGNTSEFSQCAVPPERGTIIVEKGTLPDGDPQVFCFTASFDGDGFCLGDGGSSVSERIRVGVHSVAEIVPSGWDSAVVCSDGSPPSAIQLGADETVTCTFTNTKRGSVTLRKTTNGVVDPSKDICFVLSGPRVPGGLTRCTGGDPDGVLEWPNLVPDPAYTICESPVPAGFTSFWTKDGEIVTPYNPDASRTPPEDLGNRCFDFPLAPGETVAFEVDNSRPGGDPRTIGYWKNWNRCTGGNQAANAERNGGADEGFFLVEDLLPQLIGDFTVTTCQQAVKLLSKQDQAGRNKASDAAYELGAQLLAARFNLAAGAETCTAVQQAVLDGQTLLDAIGFTGSGDHLGSKSKDPRRTQAVALAATLDRYNNGNLC